MKELKTTQYSEVAGGVGIGSCGPSGKGCNNSSGSKSNGNGGGHSYQDRSWQTSNRGSGSQAYHFGNPGTPLGTPGGCTGGARPSVHSPGGKR